ncbi:Gfo/Idh/MocA family oxidoreductase [Solirubrobacter phytolaccae]|uniref:Gfo/Idh/MocA family oxidoreductase n=1 Tax=Solirubrobacter phytolaccae TaxID=1404360 RepID=A0A9X3NDC0_9ACTN|nr:Gfo/Idh/MocA family oxidoreductase [Solirubrobacter phytolaccae]MDA0184358.1 Gfo/Idh/MocA family oxidoreductase [Solirubrobacter phytolaccae]
MLDSSDAVVRLGVVGGGLIAQLAHLPAVRALDDRFAVLALADPDPALRDALARRHGIPATFADHRSLLDAAELDAVLVLSPNGTHAPVVRDALDRGLHVLVEKPLCLSPADASDLVARARAADRVVQVGYMKRFDPVVARLAEALPEAGALRVVTSATTDPGIGTRLRPAGFVAPGPTALGAQTAAQVADALGTDDPRHVRAFSDAFLGALVHDVNLVLGICAGAWTATDGVAAEDGTLAYGAWTRADGARWSALWQLAPSAAAFREELAFHGAEAVVRLRFPAPYLGSAPAELRVETTPERRWCTPANAYAAQLEHFHACITGDAPCLSPIEDGARDVAFLTALYRETVLT